MKKKIIALGFMMTVLPTPTLIPTIAHAQLEIPAYAKWGKLALIETHKKYPHAKIVDYLHQGNEVKKDSTIENFKLWLTKDNDEFGVFVSIEFNTETEKVMNIKMVKTDR